MIFLTILLICCIIIIIGVLLDRKKHVDNEQNLRKGIIDDLDADIQKARDRKNESLADINAEISRAQSAKDQTIAAINQQKQLANSGRDEALAQLNAQIEAARTQHDQLVAEIEKSKANAMKTAEEIASTVKAKMDENLQTYYEGRLDKYSADYEDHLDIIREEMKSYFERECSDLLTRRETLNAEIEDYQHKVDAINEAIMRERKLAEHDDFYRIILSDTDKDDINYLLSILPNLRNKEILSKLIWSEYLMKPFKAMINHATEGKDPKNVIYKITNLTTKEVYIGKTVGAVSERWTEHVKSSLNIGKIASQTVHKALYGHWDEFTFEVLEIVPPTTKLGEREAFYIDFYKSAVYGYNMKAGG